MGLKEFSNVAMRDAEQEDIILDYEQYILDSDRFLRSEKVRSFFLKKGFYTEHSERGTSVGFDDFRSDILLKMIGYFESKCFLKESAGTKVIRLKVDSIPKLVFRCAKNHQIDIYRSKIVEEIFLKEIDALMSTIDIGVDSFGSPEDHVEVKRRAAGISNIMDFNKIEKIAKSEKLIPRVTKKTDKKEFVEGVLVALNDASEGLDLKMNPSGANVVNSFIHAKGKMLAAKMIRKNRENKNRLEPVVLALQAESQSIRERLGDLGFFERLSKSAILKPSEVRLYKRKNQLDNLASKIRSSWDDEETLSKTLKEEGFDSIKDLESVALRHERHLRKASA